MTDSAVCGKNEAKTKRCPRCKETRPLEAFYRNRSTQDGRAAYCSACQRDYEKRAHVRESKARWARANLAQENKRKRAWEKAHAPSCRNCGRSTHGPRTELCATCERDIRRAEGHKRTAAWLRLRRAGLSNGEIAAREGVTKGAVAHQLQRSRVARYPDLEYAPAPWMADRKAAMKSQNAGSESRGT